MKPNNDFDAWRKTLSIDVIEDFCCYSAKLGWEAGRGEQQQKLTAAINCLNAIKAGFGENCQPSLQYIEYLTKKTLMEIS